jgi:prepilin-type N-terminal cleavage/methylation domain-containing protein
MKLPSSSYGFTLIELMVAVGVMLTVATSVIVNYNSYNSTQALKQAALTAKNNIRLIQTKAASGEKPPGVVCASLTGWSMTYTATSYAYRPVCDDAPAGLPTTIAVSDGITVSSLPAANPLIFYVLARGTNLQSATNIIFSGSGKEYVLQIQPNGDISDIGLQ